MQAAVAAGLCGLGSVFVGSTEGVAKMLSETTDVEKLSLQKRIPGLGHPLHKPVDPRTVRLFEIARETGFYGKYCTTMEALAKAKGLAAAAADAKLAMAELNGIERRSQLPTPRAVEAFFGAPRPHDNLTPVDKALVDGQYLVYAIRAARDGDLTQVTAEERKQLRDQMSGVAGMDAQKAYVKSARAKYQIKVAEDRL